MLSLWSNAPTASRLNHVFECLNFRFGYMVPTITVSHIAMTSSSFLILAATYERYCITLCSTHTSFVQNHRKMIAALAILLGIISKGTMYLEFKVYRFFPYDDKIFC